MICLPSSSLSVNEMTILDLQIYGTSNIQNIPFISDSCIPLYNFSYTYDYIMSTSTSFIDR